MKQATKHQQQILHSFKVMKKAEARLPSTLVALFLYENHKHH